MEEVTDVEIEGTAVRDEEKGEVEAHGTRELTPDEKEKIEKANALIREAYEIVEQVFSAPMPVGRVQWVPINKVKANDYNPNAVARQEMKLLHTSISSDGYTQPVVSLEDDNNPGNFVIVDGYHRYTTMRKYADIFDATGGYLPLVVIDKPIADRIASTVRHNRARGKHSVQGMSSLVFQMLEQGEDDPTICNKLGLEAEELARLKHITGYSKLYQDVEYSPIVLTQSQLEIKAKYKEEHPDERIPSEF